MEVLNLIYHQFFTSSLGQQPTTFQYFQCLVPQTIALLATAIYCVPSEFASAKKATVMFSQDEYLGTFCPSHMINLTLEATALISHTLVCHFKPQLPPPCGAIPLGLVLLNSRRHSSALIHSLLYSSAVNSSLFSAPPQGLALLNTIGLD